MDDQIPDTSATPQPMDAPNQGMNVAVTPSSPAAPGTPPPSSNRPSKFNFTHSQRLVYIVVAVAIVLVIFGAIYFFILPNYTNPLSSTSLGTSTVPIVTSGYLSSCGNVDSPGTYSVKSNVKSSAVYGTCVNITSSNVAIVCNGTSISGSGPFNGTGPFSYGIMARGLSNVSVTGCGISNFSYAIYAHSISNLRLEDNNFSNNYVSNLYLSGVRNGTIMNNYITNSSSAAGAVVFVNGSTGNQFNNNTLKYNNLLGINLNSTGNRFINNYIVGSAFSFACTPSSGFAQSNFASGNTCYNQTGCAFVSCIGNNVPLNVSQYTLSPSISSCGTIIYPGTYTLATNLNMTEFTNASEQQLAQYGIPCINIRSSKVTLNCNNHYIINAYAGIIATGSNVTLMNCNVSDSLIGALLNGANTSTVSASSFARNNVSLELSGTSGDRVTNVSANGGTYGIYLSNSSSTILSNFTANNNRFGLYLSSSLGNIFNGGTALGNTRFDVFGTPDSVNLSTNIMSNTNCNITDTQWSTCRQIITNASFTQYPINACTKIQNSGLYNLTQNIFPAQTDCISILADNVMLNCNTHLISGNLNTSGAAILFSGLNNVTITNCDIQHFQSAIVANDSSNVTIYNVSGSSLQSYGFQFNNVFNSSIKNTTIRDVANATIQLDRSRQILLLNNSGEGVALNTAITLINSTDNWLLNNTGFQNNVGIEFLGKSTNNTVINNAYIESAQWDYMCSPQTSSLTAENGGINSGSNSSNCHWLAAIPAFSNPIGCPVTLTPTVYSFAQDYAYSDGATCFGIYANLTTINCNGHTVLATDGGTFAYFKNSQGSKVENCQLKGFTDPIIAVNSSMQLVNDTVYENVTGPAAKGSVIFNSTHARYVVVEYDNFLTPYIGLYLNNITYGGIQGDNITAGTAYDVYKSTSLVFTNDLATSSSGVGLVLSNSTQNLFQNSAFDGTASGMICTGTAKASNNNTDEGGNFCSSNSGCAWISSSKSACH
jgi:parallel beta-helix repeat protein